MSRDEKSHTFPEESACGAHWVASWSQAMTDIAAAGGSASDATIRITVTGSVSGTALRVHLSNRFGGDPLAIGRAVVRCEGMVIPVGFSGRSSVVIPAGSEVSSDAIAAEVGAGSVIDVDLYLAETQNFATGNRSASRWMVAAGEHCGADELPAGETPTMSHPLRGTIPAPTPFLSGVDVRVVGDVPVVVCLGDSITAAGWPERTADRLRSASIAVVNRGIPGNRLRFDGSGPMGGFFGRAGQDRFDTDVLGTAGRTHVVIALGANDLGHPGQSAPESELPTEDELISSLKAVAVRARAAGCGVMFATITPFLPAAGYDAAREQIRRGVNDWMRRSSGESVIDFDIALRDESHHVRLAAAFDSGDHLHPNDAGLDRMADEAARAIAGFL